MNTAQMTAGILAGGMSSRMGKNKSFLKIGETTLIEHLIMVCEDFREVIISANDVQRYAPYGKRVVADELQQTGPLEGVYQLLMAAQTDKVLILATDMPGMTKAFLEELCEAAGEEDCLIVREEGRLHPLCGIYDRSALDEVARMREKNEHKMRLLFDRVRTKYYDVAVRKELENINTPQEYERYKEREHEAD
jgi:molybdopterin-guanine dinucleotide biosynthesis protein A